MKKKIPAVVLVLILCVGTASAQFGSGIVYDPTILVRHYPAPRRYGIGRDEIGGES